jgi:allophanate hydrolase
VQPQSVDLVVVGAHLSGLPLNNQLQELGAVLVKAERTAPLYRLFALPGTTPAKPGMLRVGAGGRAIQVEIWRMSTAAFGAFVAAVPPPLSIGTIVLSDGAELKGFLVEAIAVADARDVSEFGGWRAYVGSLQPA